MIKFFETLFTYLRETKPITMLSHFMIFFMMISWAGLVFSVVVNFDSVMKIYDDISKRKLATVTNTLDKLEAIRRSIEPLVTEEGADRAYVARFHDGKRSLDGVHFLFFSRIVEVDNRGVSNEIVRTQNLPISTFNGMVVSFRKGECYVVEDTSRDGVENRFFFLDMGVKSTIMCPIWNADGRLIGLIGIDKVLESPSKEDLERLRLVLKIQSRAIGRLMSEDPA